MGSRFNHSCLPNCEIEDGSDVEDTYLRIHRNIQEGEEMVVTYLSDELMAADLTERRNYLFDSWGFHCECVKCAKQAAKTECACQICTSAPSPQTADASGATAPKAKDSASAARNRARGGSMALQSNRPVSSRRSGAIPQGHQTLSETSCKPGRATSTPSGANAEPGDKAGTLYPSLQGCPRSASHDPSPTMYHGPPPGQDMPLAPDEGTCRQEPASGDTEAGRPAPTPQPQQQQQQALPGVVPMRHDRQHASPLDEEPAAGLHSTPAEAQDHAPPCAAHHPVASQIAGSKAVAGRRAGWSHAGHGTGSARARPSTTESPTGRFAHVKSRLFELTAAGRAKVRFKDAVSPLGAVQATAGDTGAGGDEAQWREKGGWTMQKVPGWSVVRRQLTLGQSSLGMQCDKTWAGPSLPISFSPQPLQHQEPRLRHAGVSSSWVLATHKDKLARATSHAPFATHSTAYASTQARESSWHAPAKQIVFNPRVARLTMATKDEVSAGLTRASSATAAVALELPGGQHAFRVHLSALTQRSPAFAG
jgi:hypothetical protein